MFNCFAKTCFEQSRTEKVSNPKFEIRNSKQFRMFKNQKILNGFVWNFEFRFFGVPFVSDFDIRISSLTLILFCSLCTNAFAQARQA